MGTGVSHQLVLVDDVRRRAAPLLAVAETEPGACKQEIGVSLTCHDIDVVVLM